MAAVGFLLVAVWLITAPYMDEFPWGYFFVTFIFLVFGLLLALMPSSQSEEPPDDAPQEDGLGQEAGPSPDEGVLVCGKRLSQGRISLREPAHDGRCSRRRPGTAA